MKTQTAAIAFFLGLFLACASAEDLDLVYGIWWYWYFWGITFRFHFYYGVILKPYKLDFKVDGVKSIFIFDDAGRVIIIKTGSSKYKIKYNRRGNIKKVKCKNRGRALVAEEDQEENVVEESGMGLAPALILDHRRLFSCEDCWEVWDFICDAGVNSVCDLVEYGDPFGEDAADAISIACDAFGDGCEETSAEEACEGQCVDGTPAPTPAPTTSRYDS